VPSDHAPLVIDIDRPTNRSMPTGPQGFADSGTPAQIAMSRASAYFYSALYLVSCFFMLPIALHLSVTDRLSRGHRDRGTAWVVTLTTGQARTVAWATEPVSCKAGPPWRNA
jgi:hypothetical protein